MNLLLCAVVIGCLCIGNSHLQKTGNITSCYYCESMMHKNCADPFDTATVTSVDCMDFIKNEFPPKIDIRTRDKRQSITLEAITNFRCVKMQVLHNDSIPETVRICAPLTKTIQSACDHLKEHIEVGYSMKSCLECSGDNCNLSTTLYHSYTLLLLNTFLAYRFAS